MTTRNKKERKVKAYALIINIKGEYYIDFSQIFQFRETAKKREWDLIGSGLRVYPITITYSIPLTKKRK